MTVLKATVHPVLFCLYHSMQCNVQARPSIAIIIKTSQYHFYLCIINYYFNQTAGTVLMKPYHLGYYLPQYIGRFVVLTAFKKYIQ